MHVKFESSVPLELDPYETSVVDIKGTAFIFHEDGEEIKIADMSLYAVDYEAIINTQKMDFLQIMDAISNSLMEISNIFYNDSGLKKSITDNDPFFNSNLLHLEKIHVLKEFRGCGVGHAMFDRAMRLFGKSHGIVTVKPFPLQIEEDSSDDFSDLPTGFTQSQKKVESIYKLWEFKKLKGSKYFYLDVHDWFEDNPVPFNLEIPTKDERCKVLLERVPQLV